MELSLWFERNRSCELLQVRFKRAQSSPRTSYRGKALAFQRDAGLFQWSAAVKAFAILAVGTRANICEGAKNEPYHLEGEGGSLAATLDYAIAKPTSWIVDLFGRETNGKSFARLIFKRENSERKRAGPVRVSLSSQVHDPGRLRIFLDGVELLTSKALRDLLEMLEEPAKEKKAAPSEQDTPVFRAAWFKKVLEEEVKFDLQEVELLETMGIEDACDQRIEKEESVRKTVAAIKTELLKKALSTSTVHTSKKTKGSKSSILVASPPTAVGALSLFHHLKNSSLSSLKVYASFPSARSIITSPDLPTYSAIVLSWAAATQLYRKEGFTRFRPVMLLPRTSFGLVLRKEFPSPKEIETILLATELDGYPMKFLTHARSEGYIPKEAQTVQATFSEIMSFLPRKGDAAVAGFPISYLLGKRHSARVLWDRDPDFRMGDNILFTQRSAEPFINVQSITKAWYQLLEDSHMCSLAIEHIYSDVDFINYLYRLAALYRVTGG